MQPMSTASKVCLWALIALATFVYSTVAMRSRFEVPMTSDAADYFSYAYNLKHFGIYSNTLSWASEPPPGGIVPDALRPPGYPLFLALIPGIDSFNAFLSRVALVQAAISVLSVVWVFFIARRALPGSWPFLPALLTAISPHLANQSTYLLSETLFLATLLLAVLATLRALERKSTRSCVLAGLAWGACALIRPTVFPLPFLAVALVVVVPAAFRFRRATLVAFSVFLLVQAPWWIRNASVHLNPDERSLMVDTLHHGSYPGFEFNGIAESYGWPFRFDPASEAAERDLGSVTRDIAAKFRARPLEMARWYAFGKPGYFLSWGYVQGHDIYVYAPTSSPYMDSALFRAMRLVSLVLHWPLMLFGVAAAGLAWWRPAWVRTGANSLVAVRVASFVVLYAIAFHMVAAPYPRYGVPFRTLLYVLASVALAAALASISAKVRGDSVLVTERAA